MSSWFVSAEGSVLYMASVGVGSGLNFDHTLDGLEGIPTLGIQ